MRVDVWLSRLLKLPHSDLPIRGADGQPAPVGREGRAVHGFGADGELSLQGPVLHGPELYLALHADRRDLLNYVKMTPPDKLKHIFLIHGEPDQAVSLVDAIRSNGYENVYFPDLNKSFTI